MGLDVVVAVARVEDIATRATVEDIVATVTVDRIGPIAAPDRVGIAAAMNRVVAGQSFDRRDVRKRREGRRRGVCAEIERVCVLVPTILAFFASIASMPFEEATKFAKTRSAGVVAVSMFTNESVPRPPCSESPEDSAACV